MSHKQGIDSVNYTVSLILDLVDDILEDIFAGNPRARMPITRLSKDISKRYMLDDHVFCYHIISAYVAAREDLTVYMGKNGGIGIKIVPEQLEQESGTSTKSNPHMDQPPA